MLILPSPIKKMMYFFRYTEEIQKISNYSWIFFVFLPCNGRNTSFFFIGLGRINLGMPGDLFLDLNANNRIES